MHNPFHSSQRGFLPATLAWVLFYLGMILALPSANAMETQSLCARAIGDAEQTPRLSTALLTAIAQTESGRWGACPEAISAWPWTVTNGPDGRFFPTKSEAIDHVQSLQARGIRNIDVGCMQINLDHHPDAFENIETTFDPAANAAYAAKFLSGLFKAHSS